MGRLLVHVEGPTEENFVNDVLRQFLLNKGYYDVSPRILGSPRLRANRGGIRPWPQVKKEIVRHLLEDKNCIATTMVDYYALPQERTGAWPGRRESSRRLGVDKVESIEAALLSDVVNEMGRTFNPERFVPFVVLHEFEGLLFSDCRSFSQGIEQPCLEAAFQQIRDQFPTPEDINDSSQTAPSKRLESLLPRYSKPLDGPKAMRAIGLDAIRKECPHFNRWIERLESRAKR